MSASRLLSSCVARFRPAFRPTEATWVHTRHDIAGSEPLWQLCANRARAEYSCELRDQARESANLAFRRSVLIQIGKGPRSRAADAASRPAMATITGQAQRKRWTAWREQQRD